MTPGQAVATQDSSLQKIVKALVTALDPERIILFGSWARGDQRSDSDFDIFVQVSDGTDVRKAGAEAYAAIGPLYKDLKRGVDIVIKDRAFVERYGDLVGTVVRLVKREGKVLYERV